MVNDLFLDDVNSDYGEIGQLSILGCTDPLATNYDSTATIDDGSCIYAMPGCSDPLACN